MTTGLAVSTTPNGTPLLRQNENGPCFVISLINCILLSNNHRFEDKIAAFKTSLIVDDSGKTVRAVEMDTVYSFLIDCLMGCDFGDVSTDHIFNELPLLDSGLLINPSFNDNKVSDFGVHTQTINFILEQFDINVYHGFIMSNELIGLLAESGVKATFDACQDYLVTTVDEPTELSGMINDFLSSNPTEISAEGCNSLAKLMNPDEFAIFFKNDHYNTCTKNAESVYLLVTDVGYLQQPDIMWTKLSIIDDSEFYSDQFEISEISENRLKSDKEIVQEDNDMLVAKQLQMEEDEKISKSLQKQWNPPANKRKRENSETVVRVHEEPASEQPSASTVSSNNFCGSCCIM